MYFAQISTALTLAAFVAAPYCSAAEVNAGNAALVGQPEQTIKMDQRIALPPPVQSTLQILMEQKKTEDSLLSKLKVSPAF